MTLRFKFPQRRLRDELLAIGLRLPSCHRKHPPISFSDTPHQCNAMLELKVLSFCFQLFQVQLVMQFSGSSDHINHLSSNFNSPLLLIEHKYRHWSQFYFQKLVPAWQEVEFKSKTPPSTGTLFFMIKTRPECPLVVKDWFFEVSIRIQSEHLDVCTNATKSMIS